MIGLDRIRDGKLMAGKQPKKKTSKPASVARRKPRDRGPDDMARIGRAKLEWEGTVDALADIICLLDASGRVLRANRAVERWGLGPVNEVVGAATHELLHRDCDHEDCALHKAVAAAWARLNGKPTEFEHHDIATGRVWNVALRPLRAATAERVRTSAYAALIVSDVSELQRARAALEGLNAGLESRVVARTRELADANRDLRNEIARREAAERAQRSALEELERLSGDLITAQERERRRISVELHDSVGQSLTAVKYSLERAKELVRRPGSGSPLPVLELALEGVRQSAEQIREIAMNLRPTVLDDMGASSAVAWLCRQFAEIYPTLAVVTELSAGDGDIPDRLSTAIYRSTQELLNNVAKHAEATEVRVELRRDGMRLSLTVRDNGVGIPETWRGADRDVGNGLRNLRERAGMTGGRFSISRASPSGVVARLAWQLMNDEVALKEAAC